jgi:hypothetical protein
MEKLGENKKDVPLEKNTSLHVIKIQIGEQKKDVLQTKRTKPE